MEMCFREIHIFTCLWEYGGKKIAHNLTFCLEFLKLGGYDFSHKYDDPQNNCLISKRLVEDTRFDTLVVDYRQLSKFVSINITSRIVCRPTQIVPLNFHKRI